MVKLANCVRGRSLKENTLERLREAKEKILVEIFSTDSEDVYGTPWLEKRLSHLDYIRSSLQSQNNSECQ